MTNHAFGIPQEKLDRLLEGGGILSSSRRVHVKHLAAWVGLLQSVRLAVGPLVSLMCRSIYDDISNARSWSTVLKLSTKCRHQVDWWVRNLSSLTGYPISKESTITAFEFALAGDASDKAVSYTHLRAHETVLDLVCRLLLEKKK